MMDGGYKFQNVVDVNHTRRKHLKKGFKIARSAVCLYERLEKRATMVAEDVASNIKERMRLVDKRFSTRFVIRQQQCHRFVVYCELSCGEDMPSLYVQNLKPNAVALRLEAETKEIWKKETSLIQPRGRMLNSSEVQIKLHAALRECLARFSSDVSWQQSVRNYNLRRIDILPVSKLVIHCHPHKVKVNKPQQIDRIEMQFVASVTPPSFCQLWMERRFGGSTVPVFTAPYSALESEAEIGISPRGRPASSSCAEACDRHVNTVCDIPGLQWNVSYHFHEYRMVNSFKLQPWHETWKTLLTYIVHDKVLAKLSFSLLVHVFLQTTDDFSRWMQFNYTENKTLTSADSDSMIECFLTTMMNGLQSRFIPNHFNHEINMLDYGLLHNNNNQSTGPESVERQMENRLRVVLRGGCECCRTKIVKSLDVFTGNDESTDRTGTMNGAKFDPDYCKFTFKLHQVQPGVRRPASRRTESGVAQLMTVD